MTGMIKRNAREVFFLRFLFNNFPHYSMVDREQNFRTIARYCYLPFYFSRSTMRKRPIYSFLRKCLHNGLYALLAFTIVRSGFPAQNLNELRKGEVIICNEEERRATRRDFIMTQHHYFHRSYKFTQLEFKTTD